MSDNPYAPPPPNPQNPYGAAPPNPYANPQAGSPYGSGPSQGGFNPYAPPSSQAEYGGYGSEYTQQDGLLADRGTRLGARMVDGVLYVAAAAIGVIPGAALGEETAMFGGIGLAIFVLAVYQWYLISTTGQSIAKKWLGIRIVRVDGSELGFLYGVFLRDWVLQAVSALFSPIGLIDALMIFGEERRCLHDHIAGTKVIIANS
jgi:uncharacterized RDD family membrane protein YckC